MFAILSNYGLRFIDHQAGIRPPAEVEADPVLRELAGLRKEVVRPFRDDVLQRRMIADGLIQTVGADTGVEEVALRYRRNPLENVRRVAFEYTTVCQLSCLHCRNGHLKPVVETRVERLQEAVDLFVPMGVKAFHFIGGEVTLYGTRWLEVVEHVSGYEGTETAVLTSGWFLEETDFRAAGERYADDRSYLRALRDRGLTHVVFSVDGPEEVHDRWRGFPGLYRRITRGFDKAREAGLIPRVSLVVSYENQQNPVAFARWLMEMADLVHPDTRDLSAQTKIKVVLQDPDNYVSNFIDVGNAVGLKRSHFEIDRVPDEFLRCKNLFRPHPSLRIQANGDLSLCPLIDSGHGFGNIHEQSLLHLLNHLQDSFVFRLHAEQGIAAYREHLDREIFGDRFDHVCSLRAVLTTLARTMHERGIDGDDAGAIRELNVEVARKAGFLPAGGPVAVGRKRPG